VYMDNQDVADPFGPTTFNRSERSSRKFLSFCIACLLNPSGIWTPFIPTSPTTFRGTVEYRSAVRASL